MYKQNFVSKAGASTDLGNQKIFYVIALASVLMAMLFGLFAVTANPIIISLAIALIAGTVLLVWPEWIIWLILSLGLLVVGLIPLYFDFIATKAAWGVSLLGFFLMFIAFIKVAISPSIGKNTPAFIWAAFGFLVYALLNSLIQLHSVGESLSGFKRYFQLWGLIFALCWIVFDKQEIRRWQIFVLLVALVQLPFAIYENIIFVPLREGLQNSVRDMIPIDVVAGTFGSSLTGGGRQCGNGHLPYYRAGVPAGAANGKSVICRSPYSVSTLGASALVSGGDQSRAYHAAADVSGALSSRNARPVALLVNGLDFYHHIHCSCRLRLFKYPYKYPFFKYDYGRKD